MIFGKECDASRFYSFWLNSYLTSFTKKVMSGVSNIKFKQSWWHWKANSNIYKFMFHEIWLIMMFTRSKRDTKGRLKS
jgi:hypothetical protein